MARKIKNAPVALSTYVYPSDLESDLRTAEIRLAESNIVIADEIVDPVIDHSSQLSSWSMAETSVEPEFTSDASLDDEFGPVLVIEAQNDAVLESLGLDEEPVLETQACDEPVADAAEFTLAIESFTEEDVTAKAHAISAAIDDRAAFETATDADNTNIHKTLAKVRSAFVSKAAARVMLATNVSEAFINRSVNQGSCYNVYALGKIADLMKAATSGVMSNAINIACMRSLFAMQAAGKAFNMEVAKACASKQYSCDAAIRQHLIRHTVAPGTASTQASSTMQAMVTLGIVSTSGGAKNPTYTLANNALVETMRKVLAA